MLEEILGACRSFGIDHSAALDEVRVCFEETVLGVKEQMCEVECRSLSLHAGDVGSQDLGQTTPLSQSLATCAPVS